MMWKNKLKSDPTNWLLDSNPWTRYKTITVIMDRSPDCEAAKQAKERGIGLISMCIMSNPEYESEKNSLKPILHGEGDYDKRDLVYVDEIPHVKQYIKLAHDAQKYGVDYRKIMEINQIENHRRIMPGQKLVIEK